MTTTILTYEGKRMMRVHPAEWMLKSKLIKDHVDKKDLFLVDLMTGQLTIVSAALIEMQLRYADSNVQNVVLSEPGADVKKYRDKLRAIVREARGALGE